MTFWHTIADKQSGVSLWGHYGVAAGFDTIPAGLVFPCSCFEFTMAEYQIIPLPTGFRAAGVYCGIKKDPALLDLSLFVSDGPATAAGVFTTNLVNGAPVKVSRSRVPRSTARGVVINSGNANACTGEQGIADARWMTAETAAQIGCDEHDILVCSTGVIGRFLPRDKLGAGIPAAAAQLDAGPTGFLGAAQGMMTTDTFPKLATRTGHLGGADITISGA